VVDARGENLEQNKKMEKRIEKAAGEEKKKSKRNEERKQHEKRRKKAATAVYVGWTICYSFNFVTKSF